MALATWPRISMPMNKPRFYFPASLQPHRQFELPDAIAHYALRVLRLKDGAEIILFDGQGGQYPARLASQGKKAFVTTRAHDPLDVELAGHINLVQGLPSADKMDWIIEKAVELGAHRVTPITAQRSVIQLRGERLEKRLLHWQRVAQSASEQCGRNRIMVIERPRSLQKHLEQAAPKKHETTILCHPDQGVPLEQAIQDIKTKQASSDNTTPPILNLMVGPEGGWSGSELTLASQYGLTAVQFGPRILRTETAGLALIAASTALLGWNVPATR